MPGMSGIEVARRVGERTRVILYTGHSDRALLVEALDAGVRGFVLKEAPLARRRASDRDGREAAACTSIRCSPACSQPAATERR